jgi:16S rRNA (guanine527-N7)-methyltransferase
MSSEDLSDILGFDVSRETLDLLKSYQQLVQKWNPVINLASKQSMADLWNRHIVDSAQVFPLIPSEARLCVDVGSGGGFPGIVLAAISTSLDLERHFILVESDQRKSTFLRQVIRDLSLKAEVRSERIEKLDDLNAEVFSARALASLSKLLQFAQIHLTENGVCLFPKGENYREEIEEAQKRFIFEYEAIESVTDSRSAILKIHGIKDV